MRPNEILLCTAGIGGHVDILQCFLPHVEVLRRETVEFMLRCAARDNRDKLVQWLYEEHCRAGAEANPSEWKSGSFVMSAAIPYGHFEIAKRLADAGYQLDRKQEQCLADCARTGDLKLIKWLHECRFTQGTKG